MSRLHKALAAIVLSSGLLAAVMGAQYKDCNDKTDEFLKYCRYDGGAMVNCDEADTCQSKAFTCSGDACGGACPYRKWDNVDTYGNECAKSYSSEISNCTWCTKYYCAEGQSYKSKAGDECQDPRCEIVGYHDNACKQ